MCQECFERVKNTKQALTSPPTPAPAAAAAPAEPPVNLNDNSFLLELGSKPAAASSARTCPECARPITEDTVICIGCGYNLQTGKRLPVKVQRTKKVKEKGESDSRRGGFTLADAGGGTFFLIMLAIYGALIGGAVAMADLASAFILLGTLIAFGISIWLLIDAFKSNIMWGVGSLFAPIVALIYAGFFCEDDRVKGAYFGMIIGYISMIVLAELGHIPIDIAS
jgi:hypothetical protein